MKLFNNRIANNFNNFILLKSFKIVEPQLSDKVYYTIAKITQDNVEPFIKYERNSKNL